ALNVTPAKKSDYANQPPWTTPSPRLPWYTPFFSLTGLTPATPKMIPMPWISTTWTSALRSTLSHLKSIKCSVTAASNPTTRAIMASPGHPSLPPKKGPISSRTMVASAAVSSTTCPSSAEPCSQRHLTNIAPASSTIWRHPSLRPNPNKTTPIPNREKATAT
ncbi:hypothetical protein BGZ50_000300, partial [Haplosporangium sp. Z 11]